MGALKLIGTDAITTRKIFTDGTGRYWYDRREEVCKAPAVTSLRCPDGFAPCDLPDFAVGQPFGEYLEWMRQALTARFGRALQSAGKLTYEEARQLASGCMETHRLLHSEQVGVQIGQFYFARATTEAWDSLCAQVHS